MDLGQPMCYAIGCACLGQAGVGGAGGHHVQVQVAALSWRGMAGLGVGQGGGPIMSDRMPPTTKPINGRTNSVGPGKRCRSLALFAIKEARKPLWNIAHNSPRSLLASGTAIANEPLASMEFSGKDLEDIQRVAGLLNLTVDELLQQSRLNSSKITAGSVSSSPQPSPQPRPRHIASQQRSPLFQHQESPVLSNQHHQPSFDPDLRLELDLDLDLDTFDLGDPNLSGSGSDPSELALPAPGPPVTKDQGARVVLLNPHTTSYDCDEAAWGINPPPGHVFAFDDVTMDSDAADDGSYVPVSDAKVDFDSVSEYTVREDQEYVLEDASADWSLVSASSESPLSKLPMSPPMGSIDKRYHRIAPKVPKHSAQTPSESSSHRVKKKRSPYEGSKRVDTHLTRQLHACVRCRMQRNRCIPDPNNPRGPCLTCQNRTVRMSRLPCLRYMVTDSTLFRTGLDYMPFYRTHPMVGPHYGDFHLERQWTDAPSKVLCLGQVGSMHIKIELREFVPPANTRDVDLKGRPMYAVPWAVADPDAVVEAITEYIDRSVTRYMAAYLDDTDPLVWNIFQAAYRASVFPLPNEMLKKTLRLWVACRFIESKWRCWSETGWADSELRAMNPEDPFYKGLDSPPPYIDYQFASIVMHRILAPLRKDVLRILQGTFNTHNPKDWFATFLTCFILLQNYEMQMLFQSQFARRREAQLFTPGFDWAAPRVRRMARLDAEQSQFMSQCRDVVVHKGNSPSRDTILTMGAETVLLGQQGQAWGNLAVKANCPPRYVPVSTEWPVKLEGDLAWGPASFASEDDYTLVLTEDEVLEVRSGLQHFNELGLYGNEVSPTTFPLPTLGPKLRQISADVHRGRGFAVVRGLKPDEFSPEDNVLVFLGISCYVGVKRGRQDEEGNMLMHIRDAKLSKTPQQDRPTRYSSRASTFHTDTFCDILALQIRNNASSGGKNMLASSWTIYNTLMRTHPHLRELLAQPIWSFDSRGKLLPSSTRPLLYHHAGRVLLNFAREPLLGLDGVRRAAGLPALDDAQRRALDVVEEIAKRSQIVLDARPGDVLFVNNHAVLHSREAFEDDAASPRYLVRMWLKNPELAWELPRGLQAGNARIYEDNELGEQWNVVDAPRVLFRLSERLSS
ncbi:hypothetical protein CHGG_10593 [Chaetomium globosum CBS 148.51]|uniref:TauD/TfdA-like domain-containing protein n=1 Tax=Chaetomium globosum (strain ATCC 6205 / CBS 148.51 / DSM 1962 / NBRC 6347 / NRRL 1970) TaxID=306901 RepID=Q2GN61_CHAGB|nr:uncharacterized protein CHGG_10593 [Chaetomium globosum CBS 148.51]EAQ84189.1 hypothetical protein CHGG_10593 [Chaetomium globosum CBS 148.51]